MALNIIINGSVPLAGNAAFTMPVSGMAAMNFSSTESIDQFSGATTMSSILDLPRQRNNPFGDMGSFFIKGPQQPSVRASDGGLDVQLDSGGFFYNAAEEEDGNYSGIVSNSSGGEEDGQVGGVSANAGAILRKHIVYMGGEKVEFDVHEIMDHPLRKKAFEKLAELASGYADPDGLPVDFATAPIKGADAIYARHVLGGKKEELGEEWASAWFDAFVTAKWVLKNYSTDIKFTEAAYVIASEVIGTMMVGDDLAKAKDHARAMTKRLVELLEWSAKYNGRAVNAPGLAIAMAENNVRPTRITGNVVSFGKKLCEVLFIDRILAPSATLAEKAVSGNRSALRRLIKRSSEDPEDVLSRELLKWVIVSDPILLSVANNSMLNNFEGKLLKVTEGDPIFVRSVLRRLLEVAAVCLSYDTGDYKEALELYEEVMAVYKDDKKVMMPLFVEGLDSDYAYIQSLKKRKDIV